jgi:cation diffusion facilitator family transporter
MRESLKNASDYRVIRNVTIVGSAVDASLAVGKIAGGFIAQSQALIADGIHSVSDLVTDLLVVIAARHSSHEADSEHPYGHGRIQAIATALLAVSLALIALGIAWDAMSRLRGNGELLSPGWLAVVVAGISVVAKEAVYQYTSKVARALDSNLLRANAWHSRTDALSSLIVIAGVLGVMVGFRWADAVGALGVGVIILHAAFKIGREAFDELIDTGLDENTLASMRRAILHVPGVIGVHELRTRRMGSQLLADMHIHVDPLISVSEGHHIGDRVMLLLGREFKSLTDIVVHIDPEDDFDMPNPASLPLRPDLEQAVRQTLTSFDAGSRSLERDYLGLVLHYIGGAVTGEVILALPPEASRHLMESESAALSNALTEKTPLRVASVVYRSRSESRFFSPPTD